MFTKHQLELLMQILSDELISTHLEEICGSAETVRALQGAAHSLHWTVTKDLSRADKKRIEEAEASGKVQRFTHVHNAAQTPGGWTLASKIAESRKVDPIHKAADGDSLLAALGLGVKAS